VITCVVNTLTSLLAGVVTFSILGYIAVEQHADVADVVKNGPGLVFLTYPEVVLKLPGAPFWAATFFIMLVVSRLQFISARPRLLTVCFQLLGIDSGFCLVEAFITGIVDNWSEELRPHRGKFTVAVCSIMFLLGIPMVTNVMSRRLEVGHQLFLLFVVLSGRHVYIPVDGLLLGQRDVVALGVLLPDGRNLLGLRSGQDQRLHRADDGDEAQQVLDHLLEVLRPPHHDRKR
jgi:SNF family Na+-dependent transporter